MSRALDDLLKREPAGLPITSSRWWRIETMVRAGYGWEDVAVASREWPCGEVSVEEAREIVLGLSAATETFGT